MAKQIGHIKAVGTVDDNVNFYYSELDGYLARLLPGVDTKRFWSDPAFEGSRRSAERFKQGNIMSSILYRFVSVKRRYTHLFKQVRTLSLICLKQGMEKKEVMKVLFNFLEEQQRISLSREQFDLLLDSFLMELETRLSEPKPEKVKKVKNRIDIKVTKHLSEEDIEFLELYMDDYDWTIRFEGDFPPNYQIPLFLLNHSA